MAVLFDYLKFSRNLSNRKSRMTVAQHSAFSAILFSLDISPEFRIFVHYNRNKLQTTETNAASCYFVCFNCASISRFLL